MWSILSCPLPSLLMSWKKWVVFVNALVCCLYDKITVLTCSFSTPFFSWNVSKSTGRPKAKQLMQKGHVWLYHTSVNKSLTLLLSEGRNKKWFIKCRRVKRNAQNSPILAANWPCLFKIRSCFVQCDLQWTATRTGAFKLWTQPSLPTSSIIVPQNPENATYTTTYTYNPIPRDTH